MNSGATLLLISGPGVTVFRRAFLSGRRAIGGGGRQWLAGFGQWNGERPVQPGMSGLSVA